jgi:hypothetical protein
MKGRYPGDFAAFHEFIRTESPTGEIGMFLARPSCARFPQEFDESRSWNRGPSDSRAHHRDWHMRRRRTSVNSPPRIVPIPTPADEPQPPQGVLHEPTKKKRSGCRIVGGTNSISTTPAPMIALFVGIVVALRILIVGPFIECHPSRVSLWLLSDRIVLPSSSGVQ